MRAAVFIRYHSGDGAGHVGWAFDVARKRANAGSVENHGGTLETDPHKMGFWSKFVDDPVAQMSERNYNDAKFREVPAERADPLRAYRVVRWIETQAYRAVTRNCLDDAYDVLRAYGVRKLPMPVLDWIPKMWFARFHASCEHVEELAWHSGDSPAPASPETSAIEANDVTPWCPSWRRIWHPHFHLLWIGRALARFFRGKRAEG